MDIKKNPKQKEKIEPDVFTIVVQENEDINEQVRSLESQVSEHLKAEHFHLAIDLRNVKLAPKKMIAFLINATSQARRLGGDIELRNLKPFVRNNLMTFSPKTFLSIEPSELYALYYFHEDVDIDLNAEIENNQKEEKIENKQQDAPDAESIKQTIEKKSHEDIALEILRSLELRDSDKVRINSSADALYKVCDFVVQRAAEAGFDEHEQAKLKVTTYEATLNVVEHAYFSNPDYWIDVYAITRNEKFYIVICDWGTSFEFNPNRNYDVEKVVKERRTGGFGLHIIRRSVDEIYYLKDRKVGNRLILVKYAPGKKSNE